jgi:hypothetical protein
MPISVSMVVLSSQLVIAVADQVPKFDIARSCKLDNAAMAGISVDQPLKRCISDEQQAQQQLGSQWSTFSASSRERCGAIESIGGTPSYVSLLTCLQMDKSTK